MALLWCFCGCLAASTLYLLSGRRRARSSSRAAVRPGIYTAVQYSTVQSKMAEADLKTSLEKALTGAVSKVLSHLNDKSDTSDDDFLSTKKKR